MDEELERLRRERMSELMRAIGDSMTSGAERSAPREVSAETLGAFLENQPLALVDVWAAWCGPCRMMEPVIEELSHELKGRVAVAKLDADANPDFIQEYGIQGIPTFLFFKNGQLAARLVGARPKQEFLELVRRLEAPSGVSAV